MLCFEGVFWAKKNSTYFVSHSGIRDGMSPRMETFSHLIASNHQFVGQDFMDVIGIQQERSVLQLVKLGIQLCLGMKSLVVKRP